MFAVWEGPQASMGFSLFELLFNRKLHGVLDLIKENWEKDQTPANNEIQYVLDLGPKLHWRGCHEKHQQRLHKRGARLTGKQSPSSSKLDPFWLYGEWGTLTMKWYGLKGAELHRYITSTSKCGERLKLLLW